MEVKVPLSVMSMLAKINALWRIPLILIFTAAMATVSVFFSLLDGTGKLQHRCARTWSRLILAISRVRVDIQGLSRLDPGRAYVFASNHLSMFDIWAFLGLLPFQFRFIAKASLFRWPFLGWHLKRSGNIPIDRHNPRQAVRSLKKAGEKTRAGVSIVVFPEGMRTWGESVAPFKRGSFLLAQEAAVPIVPVTIIGSHRLLPRGSMMIRPGRMQMIIHPPLEHGDYKDLDLGSLVEKVRTQIVDSYRCVS